MMIKPNVLIKHEDGAPLQIDMNLSASFQNRFELGAGYRKTSSINMLAGVYLITNFRLIYNYNIAVKDSPLGNTHGVILSYQFGKGYSNGS